MRCFCIGHRDTPEAVYPRLLQATEMLVKNGVTEFIVGGYGAFDRMAARAVNAIKARYAVRLTFLTPYHSRPVPHGFDGAWYPFETVIPPRVAIVRANRAAVDICNLVLTYAKYTGNAHTLADYARRKGKIVINLAI